MHIISQTILRKLDEEDGGAGEATTKKVARVETGMETRME
jgi:hypothetical protein